MCDEVIIDGEFVETIGGLRSALRPAGIIKSRNYENLPPDDACLCGVDISATLIRAKRDYDHDPGSGRWKVLDEPVAETSGKLIRSRRIRNRN